jgi:hypothetical protein
MLVYLRLFKEGKKNKEGLVFVIELPSIFVLLVGMHGRCHAMKW